MSARALAAAATLAAALTLTACGASSDSGSSSVDGPISADIEAKSAHQPVGMGELAASVEAQAAAFLGRAGTALDASLGEFLGPDATTSVEEGSAECRPGARTASISDPRKYPFACIVGASAAGDGLEVEITLGFVGTELDGRCWRAANERALITGTKPTLLDRREAMRPVNQIAGCA